MLDFRATIISISILNYVRRMDTLTIFNFENLEMRFSSIIFKFTKFIIHLMAVLVGIRIYRDIAQLKPKITIYSVTQFLSHFFFIIIIFGISKNTMKMYEMVFFPQHRLYLSFIQKSNLSPLNANISFQSDRKYFIKVFFFNFARKRKIETVLPNQSISILHFFEIQVANISHRFEV